MLNEISPDEAKAIRKGRKVAGLKLTQERLASLFGVTKRSIQGWEAGEQPIDGRTALAFRLIERASQDELDTMWEAAQADALRL